MFAAWFFNVDEKISLQAFQTHKAKLLTYVLDHPVLSGLIFGLCYTSAVALSLPIATLLTLTGGFLFGQWLGLFYVIVFATLGATIIFTVAKSALGTTLREKAGGLYQKIEHNMKENAVGYLLFLRLVPLFPFFLVNIVPALFNVSLRVFVITTFLGIIPGSFVYVNLGKTLGDITRLNDLVSGKTILAFGLLGLFALIPTVYTQIKNRRAKR